MTTVIHGNTVTRGLRSTVLTVNTMQNGRERQADSRHGFMSADAQHLRSVRINQSNTRIFRCKAVLV